MFILLSASLSLFNIMILPTGKAQFHLDVLLSKGIFLRSTFQRSKDMSFFLKFSTHGLGKKKNHLCKKMVSLNLRAISLTKMLLSGLI